MKLALFDCTIIPFFVCQLHEITFKNSHVVTVNNLNDLNFFFLWEGWGWGEVLFREAPKAM